MNLVDSSGWLEYFAKGVNGAHFAPPIQDSAALIVPTICLYEVFKKVVQQFGEEEALKAIALMSTGTIIDLDQETAVEAALLSIEHRLPMADSMILATARLHNAVVWTQDEHFNGLEGVRFFAKGRAG